MIKTVLATIIVLLIITQFSGCQPKTVNLETSGPTTTSTTESTSISATVTQNQVLPAEQTTADAPESVTTTPSEIEEVIPATTDVTSVPTIPISSPTTQSPILLPNLYESKLQLYKIHYPPRYTVSDSNSYTVTISGEVGGISILTDRLTVSVTPKMYYEMVAAGKVKQLPTWTATSLTEIIEDGEVVGYKYDYSNVVDGDNWVGKGMVFKKGGFGFYVVFTTPESNWDSYKDIAVLCLDSFVLSKIASGSYSNLTLGVSLNLPLDWSVVETGDPKAPLIFYSPYNQPVISAKLHISSVAEGTTPQQWAANLATNLRSDDGGTQVPFTFVNSVVGYEFSDLLAEGGNIVGKFRYIGMINGTRLHYFLVMGTVAAMDAQANSISQLARTLQVTS